MCKVVKPEAQPPTPGAITAEAESADAAVKIPQFDPDAVDVKIPSAEDKSNLVEKLQLEPIPATAPLPSTVPAATPKGRASKRKAEAANLGDNGSSFKLSKEKIVSKQVSLEVSATDSSAEGGAEVKMETTTDTVTEGASAESTDSADNSTTAATSSSIETEDKNKVSSSPKTRFEGLLSPVPSDIRDDTEDIDDVQDSEHFDTRQSFLNLCQGNHYQFDQLRRAKHTSMMVLYHIHNPDAPKFVPNCNHCHALIGVVSHLKWFSASL
jgi:hypothetical protein